jgi:hypothetical protein
MKPTQQSYLQDYVFEYCENRGYDYTRALVILENKKEIIDTLPFQLYCLRRVVREIYYSVLGFVLIPIIKFILKVLRK